MSTKRHLTAEDIDALRAILPPTDTLVIPQDTAYATSITRWSRAAEKPAGASLLAKTTTGISAALSYATKHNIDIAVRGGGHSTAGASSTTGGLLIDLNAHMRHTAVDVAAQTVRVGGGALWGDVDSALAAHGLATVGGTVADTGVGGLTLGGGYGWLSGRRGLVIDNLIACTLVLADGRIVRASEDEEPELFWAVRGAGQNFGVAVEFEFKAWKQSEVWAGMMLFPPTAETVEKVVGFFNDVYAVDDAGKCKVAGRAGAGLGFVRPPPAGGKTMLFVAVVFDGPEDEALEVFAPLRALEPVVDTIACVPYEGANKLMQLPIGARVSLKGSAFELPLRAGFVTQVGESFDTFADALPDAVGSQIMWELLDPTTILRTANTGMAYANRGRHLNAAIVPLWYDAANDAACRQWSRDVAQMFKTELEERGAQTGESQDGFIGVKGTHGATMVYGNYDQYEERSRDVFGGNYQRLQALKQKYDPTNLFNKLFAITPKA